MTKSILNLPPKKFDFTDYVYVKEFHVTGVVLGILWSIKSQSWMYRIQGEHEFACGRWWLEEDLKLADDS